MPHADTDTGADVTARALARVEAARARADAATPGPWSVVLGSGAHLCTALANVDVDPTIMVADFLPDYFLNEARMAGLSVPEDHRPDMVFAAHARADVPLLATIAAAAVRLCADPDWLWYYEGDASESPHCVACGVHRYGEAHAPDCRAMQLDAAIRAAGEPTS